MPQTAMDLLGAGRKLGVGARTVVKSFKAFRLDTQNHLLWCHGDRVSIAPKAFDVLAYLVEHAGQLVTQDQLLQALWSETYVNPEILRKYILEIRKILGDRSGDPEFIETVPRRGYRFISPVSDESATELKATPEFELTSEGPIESELVVRSGELSADSKNEDEAKLEESLGAIEVKPQAALDIDDKEKPRSRVLWNAATVAIAMLVIVATTGIGGHFASAPARETDASIVVLPFVDMSPAKDQEYFSDGLSDQLIQDLARVSGLKVVGRSSAFQFKGKNEDLREVGRKLGVANVLEGTVRREGNRVRITAELIKTADGFQLWSQSYDRRINDIFAVQDEIAQATTDSLQSKLLGSKHRFAESSSRKTNQEAYQAYLQAKFFSGQGQSREDLEKALAYVNKAINIDDEYAPAWALRASVHNMMAEVALMNSEEGFRKARGDAELAIALDPTSAAAYLALATTNIFYDWDWESAATCLDRASTLEPGNSDIFRIRSYLSMILGDLDGAIKLYRQAASLDPLRANSYLTLGQLLYTAGRYDEAVAAFQKALDLNSRATYAHGMLGQILVESGEPQQGLEEVEKEPSDWGKLIGEAVANHALGREQLSNVALSELIRIHGADAAYQIAQVYSYRGENGKAFEWLERAYTQRDAGLPDIKTDPLFRNLRHDERYSTLLRKLRLPA